MPTTKSQSKTARKVRSKDRPSGPKAGRGPKVATKKAGPKKSATTQGRAARQPLTRARVVEAALSLVDAQGAEALSMRTVAASLGVEAMSLYRYVSDKDDLLLAVADRVISEVEVPPLGTPWREAMRRRAGSAREVFLKHPSAAIVVESCATMTPSRLAYADQIVGLLMRDGFDATLAYRAFLLLDSYVYGFTMQELSWPRGSSPNEVPVQVEVLPSKYPHFAQVMVAVMSKVGAVGLADSYTAEFRFGLELILNALENARLQDASASSTSG